MDKITKDPAPGAARLLGLAARAGRIKSGGFAAEQSIKSGKAVLCLLAADASEPTIKKYQDMCIHRQIPVRQTAWTMEALGAMIGRGDRASVTVEDPGFANRIIELLSKGA